MGNNPTNYVDPTGHSAFGAKLFAEGIYVPGPVVRPQPVPVAQPQVSSGRAVFALWGAVGAAIAGIFGGSVNREKTKDKNQNTTHDTPDEALEHAKEKVGGLGDDKITILDQDGNVIGERSADGKREWRIDNGHVNWKVTQDGTTTGGHAEWTNGEYRPNGTDSTQQWEVDSEGNWSDVGTTPGGRGQ